MVGRGGVGSSRKGWGGVGSGRKGRGEVGGSGGRYPEQN